VKNEGEQKGEDGEKKEGGVIFCNGPGLEKQRMF
jgi:hypothetical protein